MISRKENLLMRPWQQRKFDHHRQKVKSALPAIDSGSPHCRDHVSMKLKKLQKEKERCKNIEEGNYLLLKKLNYIMRTRRIDNTWRTPQPNFLNRIPIYNNVVPQIEDLIELDFTHIEEDDYYKAKNRKLKCVACTPKKTKEIKIPEERIPWEPEKIPVNRFRSKSVPVRKPQPLPIIKEKSESKPSSSKERNRERKEKAPKLKNEDAFDQFRIKEPQRIVLSRGCLKLSVNFPSDTIVTFQEGNVEKFLMRGVCHCKLSPKEVF
ncbi:LOW QUALITY PROTEIN: uncharacterized protein [Leptinotarsa decemlineata]|uniref:LOW QUALITY PROTEIN: uncharacterized protein n=1 Tax=Leptinotarsa decemlineata TaxID=7539 RepID=UPI003D306F7D